MSINNKLGKNIKALRIAFGETQDDLAAALVLSKNAISNYERGDRQPPHETLMLLSKHFGVSIEELTNSDLSAMKDIRLKIDYTAFWKSVDIVLPIISSEYAMNNDHFRKAYGVHRSIYENLHNMNIDVMEKSGPCIIEYGEAYEDDSVKVEASANIICLMILVYLTLNSSNNIKQSTAMLFNVVSRDEKAKKILDSIDSDSIDEIDSIRKELYPVLVKAFDEFIIVLKHSKTHSDLADYYLALKYVSGIVDNNLDNEINQRIGLEMINNLVSVGNGYALSFIRFITDSHLKINKESDPNDN